jgi:hypothetical protein
MGGYPMGRNCFLLMLIGTLTLFLVSAAIGQSEINPNSKPGCWIINEQCSDDDPDYLYFTGEGKSKKKSNSRRARRTMKRIAQIVALGSFSSYLNDTIESYVKESNVCTGTSEEGMTCKAEITSKAVSYTKSRLKGKDYRIADEYYSSEENTFFVRIKVKQDAADKYLENVKKVAEEYYK